MDASSSGGEFSIRRRKVSSSCPPESDFSLGIGSDEETKETDVCDAILRKPSRVTLNENLTVFVDDDDSPSSVDNTNSPLLQELPKPSVGFFDYFWSELTRGYSLNNDHTRYTEKRRKVYAFFRIPYELEKFLFYGLLQCIDAFTYLFTFLPIRFVMSLFKLCSFRRLNSAETCDFLKVGIICVASYAMHYIDTSVVYHQVRGQGVIKLYIFYNMLEVADKLFSSLGQDVLDALFWTANEKKSILERFLKTIFHFIFAVIYATLHTFLVLLQATTLNVAFNSHNQSLLMIMMSNNFVELKGSVFKKFAKANLFQMSCSDVRERFHIMALLFVVMVRNMMAVNWSFDHFQEMIPDLLMVCVAELLVDWLKHAFITKFNEINAEVYKDFTITIAFDVVKSRDDASAFSDYSDQVARRMGFIPIPLSIMLIRVVSQTFSFNSASSLTLCALAWLLMLLVKICNGIVLLGRACQHVTQYRELQAKTEFELYRKRILDKKSKSAPSSPKISLIDFNDVLHQPPGVKGFTVSDLMTQWEELQAESRPLRTDTPQKSKVLLDERTPRRTKSFANLPRARRDNSEPPSTIPEASEEKADSGELTEKDDSGQSSPKKKMKEDKSASSIPATVPNDCEVLSDVTAYTMLAAEKGVERIE